jgi:hypothetical protein
MKRSQDSWWRSLVACSSIALLSVILLVYSGRLRSPSLGPHHLVARDFVPSHQAGFSNITKRLDAATYAAAITKGSNLHCLMGMTQAQAQTRNQGVSLEAPAYLQDVENIFYQGWNFNYKNGDVPYYSSFLDAALATLASGPTPAQVFHRSWVNPDPPFVFSDPSDPDFDELQTNDRGVVANGMVGAYVDIVQCVAYAILA